MTLKNGKLTQGARSTVQKFLNNNRQKTQQTNKSV